MHNIFDVLIIGSGAAGLSLGLRLAHKLKIAIVCKSSLSESATLYAQGGISAVLKKTDSIESHIKDTTNAGAGLCNTEVVEKVISQGKDMINWLSTQGVQFTTTHHTEKNDTKYHLNQEGGHSHRRILHAGDTTGKAISYNLGKKVREIASITLYENHLAVDLITEISRGSNAKNCVGVYLYDTKTKKTKTIAAKCTVLACGGAGKAYLYTSNPDTATGDGIAMAYRAGADIANMEFVQFHPTCLHHPQARSFLISEALRGEGAVLTLPNGKHFMKKFHPLGAMAPRDIVARAIDHEMKKSGVDHVHLDISHKNPEWLQEHFPNIYKQCLKFGYDLTKEPIPVVPAAHYFCGGIKIDLHGKTNINNLYAIGEVSSSGLHGANRLASNSLLECLVFAASCAETIIKEIPHTDYPTHLPTWDDSLVTDSDEEVVVSHNWDEIRRFMWDYVGIVRTNKRLRRAKNRVEMLSTEINEYYANFRINNDLIELRNLVIVAQLIITNAIKRQESRGLHYSLDYPHKNPNAEEIVLNKNRMPRYVPVT